MSRIKSVLPSKRLFYKCLLSVEELANNSNEVLTCVDNSVKANEKIADSISDLSATSEQVAASSESSLEISERCVDNMKDTKELLSNIFKLSEQL